MSVVKKWLANEKASMADGLNIYNQVKITSKYDDYFRNNKNSPPGSLAWNILKQQLQLLVHRVPQNDPAPKAILTKTIKIDTSPTKGKSTKSAGSSETKPNKTTIIRRDAKSYNDLSEKGKLLYDENMKLIGENKSIRASMEVAATDADRKILAERLCANEEKIDKNYSLIDADQLPDKNKNLSPLELAKTVNAAKNYLRRYSDSEKPAQMAKCKEYKDFLKLHNITL